MARHAGAERVGMIEVNAGTKRNNSMTGVALVGACGVGGGFSTHQARVATVVATNTGAYRLLVIEARAQGPRRGNVAGGAGVARCNMRGGFTCYCAPACADRAIVAVQALANRLRVVYACGTEGEHRMAGLAIGCGIDVSVWHIGGCNAVVADGAATSQGGVIGGERVCR